MGAWASALRRAAAFLAACAVAVSAAGCVSLVPVGVSRWPIIEAPPPIEWTPEELDRLGRFAAESPDIARKLVNQAHALRAAIDAYNRSAMAVNVRGLRALGYSDAEISLLGYRIGD